VDLLILVSDNESWLDSSGNSRTYYYANPTQTLREWGRLKQRNPKAKLICIDIQPYATIQAIEREDILNIGGFSDAVFTLLAQFSQGEMQAGHWVSEIEAIALPSKSG